MILSKEEYWLKQCCAGYITDPDDPKWRCPVLRELVEKGYIEKEEAFHGNICWTTTPEGHAVLADFQVLREL